MSSFSLKPVSNTPYLDEDTDSREDIKNEISDWFYENFEPPIDNMPRDPKTGLFEWIWGGPFDAREEIEDAFINLDSDILDDVIDEIQFSGTQWAPHIDRVTVIDKQQASYDDLQRRIKELEQILQTVRPTPSAIGGNNPPENIGLPPYGETDEDELKDALATLQQPKDALTSDALRLLSATATVRSKSELIGNFLARHGEKFAESFSDQLGKRTADSITLASWLKLSAAVYAVYKAAQSFAASIGMNVPF